MNTIAPSSDELTAPAAVTGLPRFLSYMRYPVFTREWFMARTRLFGACGLLYSLLSGIGTFIVYMNLNAAILSAILMWLAFMVAIATGPWLAMRARRRKLSLAKEKRRVFVAVAIGLLVGAFVEVGGLTTILAMIRHGFGLPVEPVASGMTISVSGSTALAGPRITKVVSPDFKLFAWFVLSFVIFLKYASYSGVFALRSYMSEQRRADQARKQRELTQLKIQKHEADQQLAILQAQIEPHFLFNTLASVRSLVTQDQGRAAAMIDGLANYLRVTLPKLRTTDSTSTLGEQLDICTSYLELMRLRMGERFHYSVEMPDELRAAPIPPLLLLPVVENAVTHGIEPKPGFGTIQISVRQEPRTNGSVLRIEVKDDGVGLGAGAADKNVGKGVGLANIRSQLSLRYGTQAQLEVSSRGGDGTIAVLILPCQTTQIAGH